MKSLIYVLLTAILVLSCSKAANNKDFFIFEPDIRLFTSYAFMNAAGYDHDWMEDMHPIRVEVRSFLDSVLSPEYKARISKYYSELGGGNFYGYGAIALHFGYPPDFEVLCDTCKYDYLDEFDGYDSILRDFYIEAQIEKLWNHYRNELDSINLRYKPFAEIALKQITDYCKVDSDFYQKIAGNMHFQEIPLMSYFTAWFTEIDNNYWIVSGPSTGDPGPGAFYHESLHKIINPVVENNHTINQKVQDLIPLAQEKLAGNYNSEMGLLCESFVRTIDKVLQSRYFKYSDSLLNEMIENEYKLGHILCFFLLENLPDYERSDLTLEAYYPTLMSNLDIKHEINRWEEYWAKKE